MKDSGEIYAQFTLSKIKASLAEEPLSDSQFESIHQVLLATQRDQRHAVDVRIFVPAIFRNYYILFFAGRDRRKRTLHLNQIRVTRTFHRLIRITNLSLLIGVSFLLAGVIAWGLYSAKSALGIDLIPGFHLSEWVTGFIQDFMEESK